ncbi:MAG: hypothetical protein MK137_00735 [Rickettsiales bacterium]|nr:hypothetical protein [Rickettsiales bacterium]
MSDRNPPDNQDELYQDPYDEDLSYSESFEDKAEVDSGSSAVATAKAKSIIIMVVIGFIAIFFLYKMLIEEEETISEEDRARLEMESNIRTVSIDDLGEAKQAKN